MSEKEGIPSKLWEVVTTLSEGAQQAAVRKAQELALDLDAGEISFQETLINLSHDRDVLREAVEKNHIVQMPLKLQNRLLTEATKVKTHLEGLMGGADTILPLELAVEDLNATIWQLNLQNLSPQVLSFESKMNDLKSQEAKLKKLLGEAQKIEQTIQRLNDLQVEAQASLNEAIKNANESKQALETVAMQVEKVASSERTALASVSVIQGHQTEIAAAAAAVRTTSAEITNAKARADAFSVEIGTLRQAFETLKTDAGDLVDSTSSALGAAKLEQQTGFDSLSLELHDDVTALVKGTTQKLEETVTATTNQLTDAIEAGTADYAAMEQIAKSAESARDTRVTAQLAKVSLDFEDAKRIALSDYKTSFEALQAAAEENIEKHDSETTRLTAYLAELEGRINTSIERATGYTLFHSFQTRQAELKKSKFIWAYALLGCVACSILLSSYFIYSLRNTHDFGPFFVMKLSISLPIIFAITFCSVQYSKERRLEEEYAFKSNISISLEPYQKLVGSLVDQTNVEEKSKYTAFIISSINRVFTSPTGIVFDGDEKGGETANALLKTAGSVTETLLKAKMK